MIRLTDQKVQELIDEELQGWELIDNKLKTVFEFENFKDAFSVMTRIALEAEVMQHHPEWYNVYNTLEIALTTHDADGITQKDIALAKAIDYIVGDE